MSLESLCIGDIADRLSILPEHILTDLLDCTKEKIETRYLTRRMGVVEGHLYEYLADMIASGRTGTPRGSEPHHGASPESVLGENIAGCVYAMFIEGMEQYASRRSGGYLYSPAYSTRYESSDSE